LNENNLETLQTDIKILLLFQNPDPNKKRLQVFERLSENKNITNMNNFTNINNFININNNRKINFVNNEVTRFDNYRKNNKSTTSLNERQISNNNNSLDSTQEEICSIQDENLSEGERFNSNSHGMNLRF